MVLQTKSEKKPVDRKPKKTVKKPTKESEKTVEKKN